MDPIKFTIPERNKASFLSLCEKMKKRAIKKGFVFSMEAGEPYTVKHPDTKLANAGVVVTVSDYTVTGFRAPIRVD